MKFLLTLVFTLTLSQNTFACSEDGSSGFLPENDMQIPVGANMLGGLSEAEFNEVIDKVEAIYSPIISSMGGQLSVDRLWADGTVNASAMRISKFWMVNMYGGLARHEAITVDGFALVMCHEVGHHIGGAPKINSFPWMNRWASNEGQSDYFATLKCLRAVFLNDDNSSIVKGMNVPEQLSKLCTKSWKASADKDICIRSGMAGASVSNLFAAMKKQPEAKFETPDASVVRKTNNTHPAFQCRLDTYLQGALCEKGHNEDVSQKGEVAGTCHGSTGHTVGLRPRCWFKPSK